MAAAYADSNSTMAWHADVDVANWPARHMRHGRVQLLD